jgi:methionyl aminopeptidase
MMELWLPMIEILSPREIELMRNAGRKAAATLQLISSHIKPGITTAYINKLVADDCTRLGCTPATLGYRGVDNTSPPFPGACCTSINEVVCHGIPNQRHLKDGDIINVDLTHIWQGYHGDTSATFFVGMPSDEAKKLVETCRECLEAGIAEVKPGSRLGNIGAAIQELAESRGFSVVTAFVGHGIGRRFHTEPNIHHVGIRDTGIRMKPGMAFTIEPMINVGLPEVVVMEDGWTIETTDGSLSAQFEHTLLVTSDGCEILTQQ